METGERDLFLNTSRDSGQLVFALNDRLGCRVQSNSRNHIHTLRFSQHLMQLNSFIDTVYNQL